MRILSVSVVFPPAWHYGGTPVAAHAVCKALIRSGHQVLAITTGRANSTNFPLKCQSSGSVVELPPEPASPRRANKLPAFSAETIWDEVPVIYCPLMKSMIPFYSPSMAGEIARHAADQDVAMIRSSWTHTGPAASRVWLKKNLPYLAYPEGNFDPWALRRSRLKKTAFWHMFDKAYFQQAAAIVALTKSEAESIRAMGLDNRVEVIPNGVDVDEFLCDYPREVLEEKIPKFRGRRIILFLGRIHPKKGLKNLVKAFKQVAAHHPEAVLLIAGPDEGGHQREIEQWVHELDLGEHVVFTGLVTSDLKVGLLKNSSVLVLPSYSEGFPVVVLEALACKRPVILTRNCHVPEVVEGGAGIEVDTTSSSIADALNMLLSDEKANLQMGQNGYRLALEQFSWRRVAQLTADLCAEILRAKLRGQQ